MERINYEQLIDPLCIPSIKILRENLKVETLYCCQGRCNEDYENLKEGEKPKHGLTGYISVENNERNKKIILNLYEYLNSLFPYYNEQTGKINQDIPKFKITTKISETGEILYSPVRVYLPTFIRHSKKELEEVWKNIENFLQNYEEY